MKTVILTALVLGACQSHDTVDSHFDAQARDAQYSTSQGGGMEILEGTQSVTAHKGLMKSFLLEVLPSTFGDLTGRQPSLVVTNDTLAITAPLSSMFAKGSPQIRPRIQTEFLTPLCSFASSYSNRAIITITAPQVSSDTRSANDKASSPFAVCAQRRAWLLKFFREDMLIARSQVSTEFQSTASIPAGSDWEDQATISITFPR